MFAHFGHALALLIKFILLYTSFFTHTFNRFGIMAKKDSKCESLPTVCNSLLIISSAL